MAEETIHTAIESRPKVDIPEAPASASVRCQIEGFEWLITIRGFETDGTAGRQLIKKIKPINEAIVKMGGGPIFGRNSGKAAPSGDSERPDTKPCPIHPGMNLHKHEKDGKIWYSHKLDDGTWCNESKK